MSEPAELLAAVEARLAEAAGPRRRPWLGVRVLVTAGGTREPIDSVRYIGNRSSGRMGYALASAPPAAGAEVTVVAANVALPAPPGVNVVPVETAAELKAACDERFDATDVLLMAAAVADFRPRDPAAHKLKKDRSGPPPPARARAHRGRAQRPGRRDVAPVRCWWASPPSTGTAPSTTRAASSSASALTRSWSTTSRSPGIGFDAADNEVTILASRRRGAPAT